MNKQDLIEDVSKKIDCSKLFSEKCIGAVLNAIKKGIKKDGAVRLAGFGSFVLKNRKAHNGFNPHTRRPMKINARNTVSFRAGKAFREFL